MCSLATRELFTAALSLLGRQHITVNGALRIKECVHMLTATTSAFQHVRSLDLGVAGSGSSALKNCLEEKLTILETFAQRQTLTHLWLTNVAFPIASSERMNIQEAVASLGFTVDDLGLFGCSFPSYTDMVSFIRTFPNCSSLYIRNCVVDSTSSQSEVIFSKLPNHKLSLSVLELSSSSGDLIFDLSSLINDACLDISRLSPLRCSIASAAQARSIAEAISSSPIRDFQLTSTKSEVFRGGWNILISPSRADVLCSTLKSSSSRWER
jgi:hypothetical protein